VNNIHTDVAIFGGGIAGLWSLATLRQTGYRAMLFERNVLGGGQSIAAQGIIHGGTKYALTGNLTNSCQAIAQMPTVWRACLQGQGTVDLSAVKILSNHQYLWTSASLTSNLAGFFASKVMRSRIQQIPRAEFPEPFNHSGFRGDLYRLEEPVLNTATLIQALANPYLAYCRQLSATHFQRQDNHWLIHLPSGQMLQANHLLLTAGSGNAELLTQLGRNQPAMQRRPLHMIMVKGDLPPLYAHCLGAGALPKLTITSDITPDNQTVWYVGGKVAEAGIECSADQQMMAAQKTLQDTLPWLNLTQVEWGVFTIDRAEPRMPNNQRPSDCFIHQQDQIITAWPTKLALAPRLADKLLEYLPPPGEHPPEIPVQLPTPPMAQQPWYGNIPWS
jgi:glycerol-3-phosphate dehydrogenase